MRRLSCMHGRVSDGRDFGWTGRQMRNRPDKMRIVRDMRIHLPGFGNRPGTIVNNLYRLGATPPFLMVKNVAKRIRKYNTIREKQKG